MENDAQTAFWINVYNALVMHVRIIPSVGLLLPILLRIIPSVLLCLVQAYLAYGIPLNSLRRLALFHKVVLFFVLL
jgi:hypothetical protein